MIRQLQTLPAVRYRTENNPNVTPMKWEKWERNLKSSQSAKISTKSLNASHVQQESL